MTWGFRNGITLGIWTQKCPCNWRLNFFFQISQICLPKALAQKYGQIWGFLGSRTPPMGLYHLVRTTRMGKNQKKKKKKIWPPLVCNITVVWPLRLCNKNLNVFTESSDWGYCPGHLYDKTEECSENYDRVEDICVRISPYRLGWEAAEEKCNNMTISGPDRWFYRPNQ